MSTECAFEKLPYHKLYINGSLVDPVKGGTFSTINPATGPSKLQLSDSKSNPDTICSNCATRTDFIWWNPKCIYYWCSSGVEISKVANGTAEDIDIAVKAARACLNSPVWGYASTGKQRAVILRKLGEIITSRKDELARLDSLDQGKPIREAEADVNDAITTCQHFAFLAEERDSKQNEVIENGSGGDFVTRIFLEPIGVIGAITPWNYPLLMGTGKVETS